MSDDDENIPVYEPSPDDFEKDGEETIYEFRSTNKSMNPWVAKLILWSIIIGGIAIGTIFFLFLFSLFIYLFIPIMIILLIIGGIRYWLSK